MKKSTAFSFYKIRLKHLAFIYLRTILLGTFYFTKNLNFYNESITEVLTKVDSCYYLESCSLPPFLLTFKILGYNSLI